MRSGGLDHFELKNPGPRPDSAGLTFHAGDARLGVLPRQHVLDERRGLAHQTDASADLLRRVQISLHFLGFGEIRTGDVAAKMAGLDFGTEAVVELCAERKEAGIFLALDSAFPAVETKRRYAADNSAAHRAHPPDPAAEPTHHPDRSLVFFPQEILHDVQDGLAAMESLAEVESRPFGDIEFREAHKIVLQA